MCNVVVSPPPLASGLHAQPSAAGKEHQLPSVSQCRYWFLSRVSQFCAVCFLQRLPQAPIQEQRVGCCCPWGPQHCCCSNPCSSTASASQTAPSSLLEVSQPFTVQYNRKIQKPFPVLHHSQALFLSKSFSLLRQHCSCCTRSLTLSPLSLHLPSILLLLFFPFLFGGAAEMKHSPPRLFLQALNCPNRSMWFSPCTSFAHC